MFLAINKEYISAMRVFVDANVYLNFFERSNDGITSLNTLNEYVQSKGVKLIFPQITQDEFFRGLPRVKNRYISTIDSAISELKRLRGTLNYLDFGNMAAQNGDVKDQFDSTAKGLSTLKGKYPSDCEKLVNDVIELLISTSDTPRVTETVFTRAKMRRFLGNPPGKGDTRVHIGDEVCWEIMLENYVDDDLVIVSNDSDWHEPFADDKKLRISSFLEREWKSRSKKNITLVGTLGEFVNKYLKPPEAKRVTEEEIEKERMSYPTAYSGWGATVSPGYGNFIVNQDQTFTSFVGNPADPAYVLNPVTGMLNLDTSMFAFGQWKCVGCRALNSDIQTQCAACGRSKGGNGGTAGNLVKS